ncbi:hypothetical protein OB236_23760 [Paenibacillus sp. WQ 127069]|uniref:DUF4304 domain-containing protein n=1 Tax=Paenibacillus baimaensis TaxID=2982185 RepID=A0ABT2UKJ4_9BACL|nr:hypothetical protein [Paenibacillus sp. WQ 127069]MCU6795128.1 hypothetical protein [Paenibacillus sp. WQ 127069]
MISIPKVLQKEVAPILKQKGFDYFEKIDNASWRFSKQVGTVNQYIIYKKSNHYESSIRIEFNTSITKSPAIEGNYFEKYNTHGWLQYQNQDSLREILFKLTEIALQHGIPWLDIMSIPDQRPTAEAKEQLRLAPEVIASQFASIHNLDLSDKNSITMLEEILLSSKREDEQIDWDIMVSSSACLGQMIVINLGGNWNWDEINQTIKIVGIGGKDSLTFAPLENICKYWSKPQLKSYKLTSAYDRMKLLANA